MSRKRAGSSGYRNFCNQRPGRLRSLQVSAKKAAILVYVHLQWKEYQMFKREWKQAVRKEEIERIKDGHFGSRIAGLLRSQLKPNSCCELQRAQVVTLNPKP